MRLFKKNHLREPNQKVPGGPGCLTCYLSQLSKVSVGCQGACPRILQILADAGMLCPSTPKESVNSIRESKALCPVPPPPIPWNMALIIMAFFFRDNGGLHHPLLARLLFPGTTGWHWGGGSTPPLRISHHRWCKLSWVAGFSTPGPNDAFWKQGDGPRHPVISC